MRRLSGRTDQAIVVERLLAISGEDSLDVDRKFLPSVTTKLGVRFLILTNELPRLNDASVAMASRTVLLAIDRVMVWPRKDTNLTDKLLTELPSILLWAIAGWQRLQARGYFLQPDAGVKSCSAIWKISPALSPHSCRIAAISAPSIKPPSLICLTRGKAGAPPKAAARPALSRLSVGTC